ncbi:hypothetical protein GNE09_11135 [Bacillus cereus]|nr:hypothetical protein [Bacillus thuringiensis]QGV07391.1 hypothetical protein GNE09_11135 [Bacillus cereus]MRA67999.1 hypothetical protein [Bacillus thuringiensis]MRA94748.1 hypothetical protein [Bacillus thuringiensis]MRB13909.1 hypothetical protein [Bacillus thuringiensis]
MKSTQRKKTLHSRALLILACTSKKEKGEEKPEEELMGKRKSSPRLATTSKVMLL